MSQIFETENTKYKQSGRLSYVVKYKVEQMAKSLEKHYYVYIG